MIEFYKYLYAGGFALRTAYDNYKNIISEIGKPAKYYQLSSYHTCIQAVHKKENIA